MAGFGCVYSRARVERPVTDWGYTKAAAPVKVLYLDKIKFSFPPYQDPSPDNSQPFGTGVGKNGQKIHNWMAGTPVRSGSPENSDFYESIVLGAAIKGSKKFDTTFPLAYKPSLQYKAGGSPVTFKCTVYVDYDKGIVGLDPAPTKENYVLYFFTLYKVWMEGSTDESAEPSIQTLYVPLDEASETIVEEISEASKNYASSYKVEDTGASPMSNPFMRLVDLPEMWPGVMGAAFPVHAGGDPHTEFPGDEDEVRTTEWNIFQCGGLKAIRVTGEGGDKDEEEAASPEYLVASF